MDEEDDSKGVHCEWLNEGDQVVPKVFMDMHSDCIQKDKIRDAIKRIFAEYIADAKDVQEADDYDCLASDLEMDLGLHSMRNKND